MIDLEFIKDIVKILILTTIVLVAIKLTGDSFIDRYYGMKR